MSTLLLFLSMVAMCAERATHEEEEDGEKHTTKTNSRQRWGNKINAIFVVQWHFCLLLLLSLSGHLITIVMSLWLHRCQWLVSFLCSFFVGANTLPSRPMCARLARVSLTHSCSVNVRSRFVHWLPVRASNSYTVIMVRLNCFMLSYDLCSQSWWIEIDGCICAVAAAATTPAGFSTYATLHPETNTNHNRLKLHNRNAVEWPNACMEATAAAKKVFETDTNVST